MQEINDLDALEICRTSVQELVGKRIWSVVTSEGQIVSLSIGGMVSRETPLRNENRTTQERRFDGEYGIFMEQASWRVDDGRQILYGAWGHFSDSGEEMLRRDLTGALVRAAEVRGPGMDVRFEFDIGLYMDVFCDAVDGEQQGNYTVFSPAGTLVVGVRSKVTWERRKTY